MTFLRGSFALIALSVSSAALVACAGADNTATLAGGEGEGGEAGEGGQGGSSSTKPVGGKGGASGKGGSAGKGGTGGAAGEGGTGTGGKAGSGGKAGASGKGGAAGKAGASGTGGGGTGGGAGASGKAGQAGSSAAGNAGSGPVGCDANDDASTYDAARSLPERADEDCGETLDGISKEAGDVDWFTYHGLDNPNILGGCNTKPYARFEPNEAAKEICIFVVQDSFGAEPMCVKGTPSSDGPPTPLSGSYGCCDAQEVQLDFNQSILQDNATIYLRVTGKDDAKCSPYKITHAYGE